jgi:hypothetical protein
MERKVPGTASLLREGGVMRGVRARKRAALALGAALLLVAAACGEETPTAGGGGQGEETEGGGTIVVAGEEASDHGTADVAGVSSVEVAMGDFFFEPTVLSGEAGQT